MSGPTESRRSGRGDHALAALCALPAASTVQAECGALSAWDRKYDLTSRGSHLFREFFNTARNIPNVYRVPFNYLAPVNTPSGFAVSNATVAAAARWPTT